MGSEIIQVQAGSRLWMRSRGEFKIGDQVFMLEDGSVGPCSYEHEPDEPVAIAISNTLAICNYIPVIALVELKVNSELIIEEEDDYWQLI